MEQHQTQQRKKHSPEVSADAPSEPGGSNLAAQASGYANAARRARENCQHGHAAEQELRNRRNRSGQ